MSPALNGPQKLHRWCRTFPGVEHQVRVARQFVTSYVGDRPEADTARLIVSELATNAIRHTHSGLPGGSFGVTLHRGAIQPILSVDDEGGLITPHLRRSEGNDQGGRGLHLVEALAVRWGVHGDERGRSVWALISMCVA
jgi:serine/threonine-protein kinase RsbW